MDLLGIICADFDVVSPIGEEIIPQGTAPRDAVLMLSRQKAEEVRASHNNQLIIAADTVVTIDGEILGKPGNADNAAEMLRKLSGRVHSVFTGVCVIFEDGEIKSFAEETEVEFYPLTDREITRYIDTGEPMDKAGAYGIQDRGALFVKRIVGDYYNVMGLPVARLARVLNRMV